MQIQLDWQGPFSMCSPKDRSNFDPPKSGGVYLWCVGKQPTIHVSYVGEASNIQNRIYQHITAILGGASWLYSDAQLFECNVTDPPYKPGFKNLLRTFVDQFEVFSKLAYENLMAYSFYWATLEGGDAPYRRAVESALIKAFQECKEPLQNSKPSVLSFNCRKLNLTSAFSPGSELAALRNTLTYGMQE